jgi:hypothetical protein
MGPTLRSVVQGKSGTAPGNTSACGCLRAKTGFIPLSQWRLRFRLPELRRKHNGGTAESELSEVCDGGRRYPPINHSYSLGSQAAGLFAVLA